MYQIIFYQDKNGKSEVLDYMEKLRSKRNNKDARVKINKITAYINQLEKHGLSIGEPYIKHLDSDIWELRPLRDRILFAYWDNNKLSQFIKRTQKTPQREIEKAKRLLDDYKRGRSDKFEK